MSNLQSQAKVQQQLQDLRYKLVHLTTVTQAINPTVSEKTFHDQITIRAKEIVAMADAIEWELNQSECCE